jgi:hypothetical protein
MVMEQNMNQLRRDLTTKNERYYQMNMLYMLNVEELKVMYLFENMSKREKTFIFFYSLRK